jgi:hypothetical protein
VSFPPVSSQCRALRRKSCTNPTLLHSIFFIFSALIEFALIRHRRKEHRFGPSPANGYTEGYAKKRRGFGFRRKRNTDLSGNALPEHTHPNQLGEPGMAQPAPTYGDGVYNRV